MTFRSTDLLWLLVAFPAIALFLAARERHRMHVARRFASERLRGVSNPLRPLRPWLLAAGLALSVVAIAGPRWGVELTRITGREPNRIILIDVSSSMAATDVGTSRLGAAKAIARWIADTHAGRVALIVFEASADVVSPLTDDNQAVIELIDTLQAGDVGHPGSDIGTAIEAAARLSEGDGTTKTEAILISDGEEQGSRVKEGIGRAKTAGLTVSTVLVGSAEGSTIPMGEGRGDLRDESGEVVTTYARAETLQNVARGTGGVFLENPFSREALSPLLQSRRRGGVRETTVPIPIERFQWPLAAAFLLLLSGSFAHRGAE